MRLNGLWFVENMALMGTFLMPPALIRRWRESKNWLPNTAFLAKSPSLAGTFDLRSIRWVDR